MAQGQEKHQYMKTKLKEKQNIPEGWEERHLGEVCEIVNGSTPKRSVAAYWDGGDIPWFTVDDIRNNGRVINATKQKITEKGLKESSVKLLPEESVLLCCTASIGEVAFTKIPLTTNQQFNGLVIKDRNRLFPYYLFYSTQKLGENIKDKSGKTTIGFLSVGTLSKENILLPPIKEQQKIAVILEAVDADIEETKSVIKATEKLKKGLMQQLFTRGIGHTKFKHTELGEIPVSWDISTVKECSIKLVDGDRGTNYPKRSDFLENGYCLFLSAKNVTKRGFTFDALSFITKEKDSALSKGKLERGDIVLTSRGTVGNVGYYNDDVQFDHVRINSGMLIFRHGEQFDPLFLYWYMTSPQMQSNFKKMGSGSAQPQLPVGSLELIRLPIVPKPEQKKIAEILSVVDDKISVNKRLLAKQTELKKGLMQDLLSGNKRVKV